MKQIIFYISLVLFFTVLNVGAQTVNILTKEAFRNPPKQYYPVPLWHMNGDLTDEGVAQQMTDAILKAGFHGAAILPVKNTKPDFLSDDYFRIINTILETAKKLGGEVILYDDIDFPSGTAGGKLEKIFPDDVRKTIDKTEIIRNGPSTFKRPVPGGKLMAAVAMNVETLERINLSGFIDANVLTWSVPQGKWRIMFFNLVIATHYEPHFAVDFLDTAAIGRYMTLTYDEYSKRLGSYFGNTIQKVFFDDVGFWRTERQWTGGFNEKFKELYGFDPALYYPALWYNIGTETDFARVTLFNTRAEMLAEGYPKMVTQWTKKHGLKSTGHPPGNYGIQPVDMNGDIFKFYRYTDIPLTDYILWYGRGLDGFKLIVSASELYDRPITATEIYGAFAEESFDSLMLKRAMMEMFVRGANYVIPHGMWYNPENIWLPPLISSLSEKLAPALPGYSDYVGRSCYTLQGGRRVSDIAILYPIASLQAGFYFDAPENVLEGEWGAYPENDYLKVSDMLTKEIRRDFTFVHPEYLSSDKYTIQNNLLHLNTIESYQDYKLMILPGGKVISLKALQKIKKFFDAGGKVLATSLLPSKSAEGENDQEIVKIVSEMFGANAAANAQMQTNDKGGIAIYLANPTTELLSKTISELLPTPDVIFTNTPKITSKLGYFSYLHKIHKDKDIYFFANSSDNIIDTEVLLRGKLNLKRWNPNTGAVSKLQKVSYIKKNGQIYTRCTLNLQAVKSTFWISK
jgi:hypothetical protein